MVDKNKGDVYVDETGCISEGTKNTFYILLCVTEFDTSYGNIWKIVSMYWADKIGFMGTNRYNLIADTDLARLKYIGNLRDWDVIGKLSEGMK